MGATQKILVLGITGGIPASRVVRGAVNGVKENELPTVGVLLCDWILGVPNLPNYPAERYSMPYGNCRPRGAWHSPRPRY